MCDDLIQRVQSLPGLPPPAAETAVLEAEAVIGLSLPAPLRRLYLEAANGGFGPRGGILGAGGGPWIGDWSGIVEVYQTFSEHPDFPPPSWLVWIFDWGCNIWSLVDCRTSEGRMWGWDANVEEDQNPLFETGLTFREWLDEALDGSLEMPSHPSAA
ncbi:MAG: hypothetical protein AUG49_22455 [Catenulispora sp. 13_1_20CM_3_70_7]|nr:MAG: hypothetical protein AUG49_22455 [Catenulispora sp. 13_1_20CM_3_70_7]